MSRYRDIARLLTFVACASMAAPCAEANAILNGSFENGVFVNDGNQTMTLPVGSTVMTNWTVVGDVMAWINVGNPYGLSAQDGDKFLDLSDYTAGAPFGGVTQTIATTVGSNYLLSYYLGSYTARWGGPPVSLLATAGGTSETCTNSSPTSESTWTLCTMEFIATSAQTAITLAGAAGFNYIGLDNVSVELGDVDGNGDGGDDGDDDGTVPEPASLGLVALGALGLVANARRYRRIQ